jgi:hypothetical protein
VIAAAAAMATAAVAFLQRSIFGPLVVGDTTADRLVM